MLNGCCCCVISGSEVSAPEVSWFWLFWREIFAVFSAKSLLTLLTESRPPLNLVSNSPNQSDRHSAKVGPGNRNYYYQNKIWKSFPKMLKNSKNLRKLFIEHSSNLWKIIQIYGKLPKLIETYSNFYWKVLFKFIKNYLWYSIQLGFRKFWGHLGDHNSTWRNLWNPMDIELQQHHPKIRKVNV